MNSLLELCAPAGPDLLSVWDTICPDCKKRSEYFSPSQPISSPLFSRYLLKGVSQEPGGYSQKFFSIVRRLYINLEPWRSPMSELVKGTVSRDFDFSKIWRRYLNFKVHHCTGINIGGCFGLFRNSLFQLFCFYTETEGFDVSMQPKQFDTELILVVVSKQFCLFQLFRNRFETSKTNQIFCWFHETNRNTTETDLALVCFGEPKIVSRTPN